MLRTILVDGDSTYIETLYDWCKAISGLEIVGAFLDPRQALQCAEDNTIHFALLDIELPGMSGIDLGKKLRELHPDIVLIYTIEEKMRCSDILSVKADYFILKPYHRQDVEEAIERAQYLALRQKKQVKIHTFGRFDVFVRGKAVYFFNAKSKELLALCVHRRGGAVTMEEAIDKLWPERPYDEKVKRLYRKAIMNLRKTLAENNISDLFVSGRGSCYVVPKKFDCDYYDYLSEVSRQGYVGEYMFEYSWAEGTAVKLSNLRKFSAIPKTKNE